MYLKNKYTRWYYNIINRAKERSITGYSENHHIIPKSLGGSNEKTNIVKLTAREHFICHKLLVKMVTGQKRYKMMEAVAIFSNNKNRKIFINSRDVELIRKYNAKCSSIRNKGNQYYKNRKPDSKELLALRSKNASNSKWVNNGLVEKFAKDFEFYIQQGFVYGRLPFTDQILKNMSKGSKLVWTEEKRKKASQDRKNKKLSEETKARMRKPKPNKEGYQGRAWYHSTLLNLEACIRNVPDWPDVKRGRLPKPPSFD
jgi:hypothetical protein